MVELRRHSRVALDTEIAYFLKGSSSGLSAIAKDVSVGGMYLATERPEAFGAELVVHVMLPGQAETLKLPGVVRWVKPSVGMGVQFGLLGVRETHAITEYIAANDQK